MYVAWSTISKKIGTLALIALALWLNGFGCSLCGLSCAMDDSASVEAAPRDCCTEESCKPPTVDVGRNLEDTLSAPQQIGCSLLPKQEAAILPHVDCDVTISTLPSNPLLLLQAKTLPATSLDPPIPLNRGGTYLRCCALLI
jgi:hypothetical protein